jgi:YD repeat-containing protein
VLQPFGHGLCGEPVLCQHVTQIPVAGSVQGQQRQPGDPADPESGNRYTYVRGCARTIGQAPSAISTNASIQKLRDEPNFFNQPAHLHKIVEYRHYQYDALLRLTVASGLNRPESYTYDGFGNLTQMTPTGAAPALSVAVDASTYRIQPYGVQYDANGNITDAVGLHVAHDVANRMVSANGGVYVYDSGNQRV